MITVQDMMTPDPVTLTQYNTMYDARTLMEKSSFRHVPIVDDDQRLIGLVTQRNILANGVSSQDYADKGELSKIESGTFLADIMTKKLVTIGAEANITTAAQLIHQNKIGCLPVVDDNDSLVGIITDHDFVAITMRLLEIMDATEPLDVEESF